jgi:hypothetical protein|tara:strand:- start:1233 stop:1910 length:678 start_codon:yes stop_codon:yes gene_type:complete|eukprot:COSAG01_NODE_358_length_18285_cov_111.744089_26_plen_226_part_00
MFAKHTNKILLVCLTLVFILISQLLSTNAKLNDFKKQVIKFKDGEQYFIQKLNDNGERIAEQDQIILSQKDAIANNLLVIEDLKKVKSQVTIKTITKIDSIFVPIIDTVDRIVFDGQGLAFLKLPTKFGIEEEWYSLYSTINNKGMWIDSLSLYNRQTITLGLKSNGIFKSPTPTVTVKNENPFVDVNSLKNVVIKNDTRFYDKKGFWYGIGVGTGILIPALIIN